MKNRLDALTEKRDQINAQIQTLRARDQAQKRKDDTRRKVLIGSVVLKMVKEGGNATGSSRSDYK